jgi:aspartyl-tRNA(Asn)/glutamyl-tRNA(Gln) amidotransferase subunit A
MSDSASEQLVELTIAEAAGMLDRREVSAVEIVDATLAQIEATEPLLHAYVWVSSEAARARARETDKELARGESRGPLQGIPIAIKDMCCTADAPTNGGSPVLEGAMPMGDARVVRKLRDAGAVIIGKTVTHEIAYAQNVVATRNPWNIDYYPGGSSAGSGAAVAARSCFAAIGTDTGGSIREPASVNGVVGVKPTNGRVSRQGVITLSASLDTVGPLARTVEDSALVLQAIAGRDAQDVTCVDHPVSDYRGGFGTDLDGMTLGVDRSYFFYDGVVPEVAAAVDAAIQELAGLGATVVEVDVPYLDLITTVGMITIISEGSAYHRDWLRKRGSEYARGTRLMLELGELTFAADYITAQRVRRVLRDTMRSTFDAHRLDALVGPTLPLTSVPVEDFGFELVPSDDGDATAHEKYVHHTFPPNVTGQPAMSVPCGFSSAGMPIGMQLIGRPFDEATLFQIGHAYERAANGRRAPRPPLQPRPAS